MAFNNIYSVLVGECCDDIFFPHRCPNNVLEPCLIRALEEPLPRERTALTCRRVQEGDMSAGTCLRRERPSPRSDISPRSVDQSFDLWIRTEGSSCAALRDAFSPLSSFARPSTHHPTTRSPFHRLTDPYAAPHQPSRLAHRPSNSHCATPTTRLTVIASKHLSPPVPTCPVLVLFLYGRDTLPKHNELSAALPRRARGFGEARLRWGFVDMQLSLHAVGSGW